MPRKSLQILDFTKGTTLKSEMLGGYGFPRVQNFKIMRAGILERRGGWDDWDTPAQDYGKILGLKRWYREDKGRTFLFAATISGGTTLKIWEYTISNKTVSSLADITENLDLDAPVLWINCDSLLIVMPLQTHGAPWSVRLKNQGTGGMHVSQLGLTISSNAPSLTEAKHAIGTLPAGLGLEDGLYQYAYTRGYGTKASPFAYGESALSPISSVRIDNSAAVAWSEVTVDVLETFGGANIVHAFRIYRTLKNGNSFYRVGEITEINTQVYTDALVDASVDLSRIPPLLTGLPPTLLCGTWHDARVWGFADDGTLHISAAGHPDIYPASYRSVIGQKGYQGHGVVVLRGNKYALKEDGIFIITGNVPNIGWRKIDDTGCFSRGSIALVGDDIYFLGIGSGGAGVYRFDGNNAELVSHQISEITKRKDPFFFKKAYAKEVGNEYWLSIMCDDPRYVPAPLPYNNVILIYNPVYRFWDTFQGQASSIECFDGPGDNQEVFISEADPAANTTGTFFRFNPNSGVGPQTTYPLGARVYSKVATLPSRITVGSLKDPRFPIDPTQPHNFSILMRRVDGSVTLNYYDNINLESQTVYAPETTYRTYALNTKYKWDVAKFDTNSQFFNLSVLDRYEYTLKDSQFPNGIFLEISLTPSTGLTPELEGMEYLYDWTNPEGKN